MYEKCGQMSAEKSKLEKQNRRAFTGSLWTTLQRGALAGGCAVMDISDCTAASSAEWKFQGGTAAERRG